MALSFLLASNSPRRLTLLEQAGFKFDTAAPEGTERIDPHLTLRELTAWNAIRKGLGVARAHPDDVVLAADTLVALRGKVIGKPKDMADARRLLQSLSGQVHDVCSSVFIGHFARARIVVFHELSRVRFKRLSDKAVRDYLVKIDPLDKAGAYAVQGAGRDIIEGIEGSYTNVVGLPMEQTLSVLADFGIHPKVA